MLFLYYKFITNDFKSFIIRKIFFVNYNILLLQLYDKLRKEHFSRFKKIIPISGNVKEKELDLSVADRQMLIERVTIIIHAAADVKFNNSLKDAIYSNTRATRDVCILAQSMKNLKVS